MIRLYLQYRKIGLKQAWHLANMDAFVERVLKIFVLVIIVCSIYMANVNTIQMRLDQQAIELHDRHVNMSLETRSSRK